MKRRSGERGCSGCKDFVYWTEHGSDFIACKRGLLSERRVYLRKPYKVKTLKCKIYNKTDA